MIHPTAIQSLGQQHRQNLEAQAQTYRLVRNATAANNDSATTTVRPRRRFVWFRPVSATAA